MEPSSAQSISLDAAVVPQLHKLLWDSIVSCELRPGQRISEPEIAAAYQVSRQPVREAFIKLAERRLVNIVPQRGTYIRRISVHAALTARFIREAVEVDLIKRAMTLITPEYIDEFDQQIIEQKEAMKLADPEAFIQLDEKFHRTLAECAKAAAVSNYLDDLNVQMNRVRNISARQFSPEKLVMQHELIVDALRKCDAEAGETGMRLHLNEFKKDLPNIIMAYPDYFENTEAIL